MSPVPILPQPARQFRPRLQVVLRTARHIHHSPPACALRACRWPAIHPRFPPALARSAPNFSAARRKAFAAARTARPADPDSSFFREPNLPARAQTPAPFRRPIHRATRASWLAPLSRRLRRRAPPLAPFHANASPPKPPDRSTHVSTRRTTSAIRGSPATLATPRKIPAPPRFLSALSPARPPRNLSAPDWPAPSPPAPGSIPASTNLRRAYTSLARPPHAPPGIRNLRNAATRSLRHPCSRCHPQISMQTEKPRAPLRHALVPLRYAPSQSRASIVRGLVPVFRPASGPLPMSPMLPEIGLRADTVRPDSRSLSTFQPYRSRISSAAALFENIPPCAFHRLGPNTNPQVRSRSPPPLRGTAEPASHPAPDNKVQTPAPVPRAKDAP